MSEQIVAAFNKAMDAIGHFGLDVIAAIAILIVGWVVAGWIQNLTARGLGRVSKVDRTLRNFLANFVRYAVLAFVLIAVLNRVGVQTASIIAVIGAAGLAIGLALQSTLQNIAAGMMLLLLRPFKADEYIDAGGIAGTVIDMGLFTTEMRTVDGLYMNIPNASLWNKPITNYSRNPTRRLDIAVGVSYADDIDGAMKVLAGLMADDKRVLTDPAPEVMVTKLGDSAVEINMRCWMNGGDYWGVRFDLTKAAKNAIEKAGYSIPFPQCDMHLIGGLPAAK